MLVGMMCTGHGAVKVKCDLKACVSKSGIRKLITVLLSSFWWNNT